MQVTVVGTGYVGLVVGACLAETGNRVVCTDVDDGKIAALNEGRIPIYEPGLDPLVQRNHASGRLQFTTDVGSAVAGAGVIFIAVGTPPDEDGSADLKHVLAVARTIGAHLTGPAVVITKSTVPVGTAEKVRQEIALRARFPFQVCSNPEFLKEGAAVEDFMKPDRVVIGVDDDAARVVLEELYAPFVRTGKPLIFMDIPSAEMTKYAANAMLATRISFMNQIAELCEKVGADVSLVRKGIGSDPRIGAAFLFPGPGYGGSCLPKDVRALVSIGRDLDVRLEVLDAVEAVNARQKGRLFAKLSTAMGGTLGGKRIAVWGLAFKAGTDDMRESPAVPLIERLLATGATVAAHDPQAMATARRVFTDRITYARDPYAALEGADALTIVTEWLVFRNPDFGLIKRLLHRPVIVDGRNLFEPARMHALGFRYIGVGRGERL